MILFPEREQFSLSQSLNVQLIVTIFVVVVRSTRLFDFYFHMSVGFDHTVNREGNTKYRQKNYRSQHIILQT